jgi:hypothetical protein
MSFRARETTQSYGQAGPSSVWLKGSFPLRRNGILCVIDEKILFSCFVHLSVLRLISFDVYPLEKARHGGTLAESKA